MGERKPWGQLIPSPDGRYVQLYEDGSVTVYDQQFNVVSDDPSPNPMRAALAHAGRESEAATSALATRASNEDARRFDAQQSLNKRQIDNQYQIALRNARSAEEQNAANRWYQEQQVGLARERLAFDREMGQARLGYDLIGTAAQLRGPSDWFQATNYQRGVANMPGTSAFLGALQNNTRLPGFGAQQAAPEAETLGTLTAKLGGTYQAGTGGTTNASGLTAATGVSPDQSNDARLAQIGNIYNQGAHRLRSGSLEQLTPTERGLLQSGVEANGGDWVGFLDQYHRSRIGQGLGSPRAA